MPFVPHLCVEQQWAISLRAAVFPVWMGQSSPNCVNCVREQGPTSVPALPTNHTLATQVPSGK